MIEKFDSNGKIKLSFDDVLLVPQHSKVKSRSDIDLSTQLGNKLRLSIPILSSNMDTVTNDRMAIAIGECGGAGVLHRFAERYHVDRWIDMCRHAGVPVIASKGIDEKSFSEIVYSKGSVFDAVCIDVAHADNSHVIEFIRRVRAECPDLDIIAGNVSYGDAALRLIEAGANIIKVGIGPGSVCSTRIVTGHGVPQLEAILDTATTLALSEHKNVKIIADGGMRHPGDIAKALAAGAHAVMLGSMLAGTDEAPGNIIMEGGRPYKTYRGMASFNAQIESGRTRPRVEGISAKIPYKGPVRPILQNIDDGIRSAFSYSGAMNLQEFHENSRFILVSGNVVRENHPHIHHPYGL